MAGYDLYIEDVATFVVIQDVDRNVIESGGNYEEIVYFGFQFCHESSILCLLRFRRQLVLGVSTSTGRSGSLEVEGNTMHTQQ